MKINNVAIETPHEYKVTINDLDATAERNALGTLVRDRIAVKRKLAISYKVISQDSLTAILTALSGEFVQVEFEDPLLGTTTKTMYVGDREMGALRIDESQKWWTNVAFSLIER